MSAVPAPEASPRVASRPPLAAPPHPARPVARQRGPARPEDAGRVGAARRPRRRLGPRLPGQALGAGGGSAERRRHLLGQGEGGRRSPVPSRRRRPRGGDPQPAARGGRAGARAGGRGLGGGGVAAGRAGCGGGPPAGSGTGESAAGPAGAVAGKGPVSPLGGRLDWGAPRPPWPGPGQRPPPERGIVRGRSGVVQHFSEESPAVGRDRGQRGRDGAGLRPLLAAAEGRGCRWHAWRWRGPARAQRGTPECGSHITRQ